MTFTRYLGGIVLTAAVAFLGHWMEVPDMLSYSIAGMVAVCCLLAGL